jgi:hypothetical protein
VSPCAIGDATVTPLLLNHPVVNFGYRIDCNGKSVFFTGDHEPWLEHLHPEDDGYAEFQQIIDQQQAQLDAALAGLDILIADSSYTAGRVSGQAWLGAWHARRQHRLGAGRLGVKTLVCTHHEPERNDEALEAVFDAALKANGVTAAGGETAYLLSREGLASGEFRISRFGCRCRRSAGGPVTESCQSTRSSLTPIS